MNLRLLHTINGWAGDNGMLDHVMIFCARWLIYVVFALAAGCAVLLVRRRQWRPLGYFAVTLLASFALLQLAGHLYVDQRPFTTEHVHQLVAHASGSSFPSDHTTAAAAVALGLIAFTAFRRLGAVLVLAALLIGFARVFVGIHWPVDIAGGLLTALAGTALTGAVALLDRRWVGRDTGPAPRGLAS
jgi:undecaprenyl-diphosphatase